MPVSFSLIIPARNAGRTLDQCLSAVKASTAAPAEIILVNDGSNDTTEEIALRHQCRMIPVQIASGSMLPRFAGARAAQFPVLVFLDADVCIQPETFSKLLSHFDDESVHAVSGILSAGFLTGTFCGDYKNEYMNFIFSSKPSESEFLYGSLWAIRKESMIYFDPICAPWKEDGISDTEMGLHLKDAEKRVLLDREVSVGHIKPYSLPRLLRNDFIIPFRFAQLFSRRGKMSHLTAAHRFSHVSLWQTASTACAFYLIISLAAYAGTGRGYFALTAGISAGIFYGYWSEFLLKTAGRGPFFLLKTVFLLPLDAAVMFSGMTAGFLYEIFSPRQRLKS